jgi:DNA polymerase-1
MPWVSSQTIPNNPLDGEWWYNALDSALTLEIFNRVHGDAQEFNYDWKDTYNFSRAMQGPALDMMLRGVRVDLDERDDWIITLTQRMDKYQAWLDILSTEVMGVPLNPRSPMQVKKLFYECLNLPPVYEFNRQTKKSTISTSGNALRKLSAHYIARPFVNLILEIRDLSKKRGVLQTAISPDGRMRTSYNVCGTETWRWSSSSNAFGEGTNMQNITEELRKIFVADEGKILVYLDLEQAESRIVGLICFLLFGATAYLDACESGDLHTQVTQMIWPELPWTGDPKKDKEIAETPFFRHKSYRDFSKNGGHGTNYFGKPPTLAKIMQVDVKLIEEFQDKYLKKAFPEISRWHKHVATELGTKQRIVNPFGATRLFFGRPLDDATLREAIAHGPQSAIGQLLNFAMYKVWSDLCFKPLGVELLMQVHDCFIMQIPENNLDLVNQIKYGAQIEFEFKGRKFMIPTECKIGWNWGNYNKDTNPDGLKKWGGNEPRTRQKLLD